MNRHDRLAIVIFIAFILIGYFIFSWHSNSRPLPTFTQPTPASSSGTLTGTSSSVSSARSSAASSFASSAPKTLPTDKAATKAPATPLHKELIPKDISIIRCYYEQEVIPPGSQAGFDLNGSGFTSEFEKMIQITANDEHIHIRNFKLVTANQIHGEVVVDADAKTAFTFPEVRIQNLPVFRAPDPFAVVRKGEVLTVMFIQMSEDGRGGRFRVVTHIDETLAKDFKIEPSTRGIEVSQIEFHPPYVVDGSLRILPGVPPGDYGLVISVAGKEAFRRDRMIHIVKPNVGQSGFIQGLVAQDPFHRPGDTVQLYVQGTGFSPNDANGLQASVEEFDMGRGSFTYISPNQMRLAFGVPSQASVGSYSVKITGLTNEVLFERKGAFKLVPSDWVAGVQVTPPVHAGQSSVLKIVGRDLSSAFAKNLALTVDEPGIHIQNVRQTDASTLLCDIQVSSGVAPGDYWIHLSREGKKIDPPYGSLIKVEP